MNTNEMFYRFNENGNAVILYRESGECVTRIDANVYPVGSDLSTRYEHPEGIVLTVADAEKIGVWSETSIAASAMGKKGGSSRTPKKSASSAANLDRARAEGKKGGYPAGRKRGFFMNPATGSVDDYDGWWYETEDGEKVNAVDRGEVVRVVKDKDGNWIEK